MQTRHLKATRGHGLGRARQVNRLGFRDRSHAGGAWRRESYRSAGDAALCVGWVERGAPRIKVLRRRGHFNSHTGRAVQGQSKLSKHGFDLVVQNVAPPSEANRPGDVRQVHANISQTSTLSQRDQGRIAGFDAAARREPRLQSRCKRGQHRPCASSQRRS